MSNLLTAEIKSILRYLSHLTVLVTVGNVNRGDDGVGPYIAALLKSTANVQIINAGSLPENIIDDVVRLKPEKVIFIDAACFGGFPGEIRLIEEAHIPETTLSTHSIPLKVICKIIQEDTKAEVYFIGIQPKSIEINESLSEEVKASADELVKYINKFVCSG